MPPSTALDPSGTPKPAEDAGVSSRELIVEPTGGTLFSTASHVRTWIRVPVGISREERSHLPALQVVACARCGAREECFLRASTPIAAMYWDLERPLIRAPRHAFIDVHRWCERRLVRDASQPWKLPELHISSSLRDHLRVLTGDALNATERALKPGAESEWGVTIASLIELPGGGVTKVPNFVTLRGDAVPSAAVHGVHRAIDSAGLQAWERRGSVGAVVLTVVTRRVRSRKDTAEVIVVTPKVVLRYAVPSERPAQRLGWVPIARPHGAVDGLLAPEILKGPL
jgi:hypothetical protein